MTTPLSPADGVRVDDVAGMKTARTGGVVRAGAPEPVRQFYSVAFDSAYRHSSCVQYAGSVL